jgi:preprotein translocase subunit SecA
MSFLSKVFGDANERYVGELKPIVQKINSLEKEYEQFSNSQMKDKTSEFKERLSKNETLDDILPEAFALVREASKRTLNQRHYDVQLMGGIILHRGAIAEMKTGEGKTLVATLPIYLNALTGKGVHLVSVNDYLVRRDATWMGQIYDALGLTIGCINHDASFIYDAEHTNSKQEGGELDEKRDELGSFKVIHEFMRPVTRREAYLADITYGTNNEYGFDYLRDNMAYSPEQMSQRPYHNFAIVDEVDSILIDEARTPLIISAPDQDSGDLYKTFSRVVPSLIENEDYNVDEKLKAISITEKGIEKVEKALNLKNIYDEGGMRFVHHLEQALRANVLFKLDRDYVVKGGEIIIVDEFTGRLMPGRRWSEGLHQAVEAKEGVNVQKESRTLATITFQNYFRLYAKLGGMTGTARTSAEEFHKVYKLDVVTVPTNKTMIRKDQQDQIYKTEAGKFRAVAREIKERHEKGQPVLVGTVSIEKNELLASLLEREGIPHKVLNAKNHEKEAEIIAQAGRVGAVTVATNMAGRGVDIILGGNPPGNDEQQKSREVGGLHVIGTERHEARRIDDQLRGRAGRQGDPGSSQFFVSTEDDLARVFGGDRLKSIMDRLGVSEDDVIENRFVSNAIQQAQAKIEGHNFDMRKHVLEYDDVMNKHRTAIYKIRKDSLFAESSKELVQEYLFGQIEMLTAFHFTSEGEQNIKEITESIKAIIGPDDDLLSKLSGIAKDGQNAVIDYLLNYAKDKYIKHEIEVGPENMRKLEQYVLLRTVDELWMDHIDTMEYLRDSVNLRAYGQRDPLVEYKIEAQKLFQQLTESIKVQVANVIFKVGFVQQPKEVKVQEGRLDLEKGKSATERETLGANNQPSSEQHEIGRNDPCYCGSGKKFKKCHGK